MIEALQVIGGVMAWAIIGAWGVWCTQDRDPTNGSLRGAAKTDRDFLDALSVIAAPLVGTYCIARWAIWRLSAEGKHEKRLREMRRRREIEEALDDEIKRLEE